jgi:undecaprenyl-diphosphatase
MIFDLIKAVIYGAIQGLTEFLPVSSSGHLVFLHDFLPISIENKLAFDVALHFGTLIAVIYYFRRDIYKIIRSFFIGDKNYQKLGVYLILATVPAAAAGYFLNDIIAIVFRSTLIVIFMLFAVGILFMISERIASQKYDLFDIKFLPAIMIGLAQTIALIPGTSRSGITIVTGMFLGLKREAAARFSFLLSIPVIFGAALMQVPELSGLSGNYFEILLYLTAFLTSILSGWWAIKFFLDYVNKNTLRPFAYYRFILALVILLFIYLF